MSKGFTLIELLAVIVILAIIALIATPIVLSIINDSKQSATIRSGEYYVDALQNAIMKKNMELGGSLNPTECDVMENGKVLCDDVNELEIEIDGEKPNGGSIVFDNGKVTNATLVFGSTTISTNEKGQFVVGEPVVVKTIDDICTLISGTEKTAGAKYECKVREGTNHTFYVLTTPAEEDSTINLIMDRNICEDGTAATPSNTCYYAYNIDGNATGVGPVTAMEKLNAATSGWDNIPNLNIIYDDEGGNFTDFVISGKARLPYKSEVSDLNNTNEYLYKNLSRICYGEEMNEVPCDERWYEGGIYGYWTLSSEIYTSGLLAYIVHYNGSVIDDYVDNRDGGAGGRNGVRPVINLKL